MPDWFKVAPLGDDELLDAVHSSIRTLILPELERLGADEFIVSQVRSTLSIVGFVRRGLASRIVGHAQLEAELEQLLAARPERSDDAATAGAYDDLLRRRLRLEIETRTAPR